MVATAVQIKEANGASAFTTVTACDCTECNMVLNCKQAALMTGIDSANAVPIRRRQTRYPTQSRVIGNKVISTPFDRIASETMNAVTSANTAVTRSDIAIKARQEAAGITK